MLPDAIWSRARADLMIRTERGDEDLFLWEHSVRVARSALHIAELPQIEAASPDVGALVAAALYHEAGLVLRCRQRLVAREELLFRPADEIDLEHASLVMEGSLRTLLPAETVTKTSAAIKEMRRRDTSSIEAQLLAEADNLEEFGLPGLWLAVRRGVAEGKAIQAVIDTWHRRRDYRFWDARLKDSFRLPEVRLAAERRLQAMDRLMQELEAQQSGSDLAAMLKVQPLGAWPQATPS